MLDLINAQFENGRSLSQNRYHDFSNRGRWPNFHWELYPLAEEYYHELNPFFLYNLYSKSFYNVVSFFTVRDGYVTFADYILKNFQRIPKLGAYYLIHKDLAPIVPPNLRQYFSCWELCQPKKIKLNEAKTVVIFGLICDQYLGNYKLLEERLQVLKDIHPDASIELFLSQRKEPFDREGKEVVTHFELVAMIKDILPGRKIHFLKTQEFLAKTHFTDLYFFDMGGDNFLVADKYIHYYVASRGGTVNQLQQEAPKNSVFEIAVSFHHNMHVVPFPENVESIFIDMLFNSKNFPTTDNVLDYHLQRFLKKHLRPMP